MSLWLVSILLGVAHIAPSVLALRNPATFGPRLRAFPRNVPIGIGLMMLGTAWFFWNLYRSDISDFQEWRPIIYGAVILIGVGNCIFVQDYLAVRATGVVALLLCDTVLDIQRWNMSALKIVIPIWCYAAIFISVWLVMAPWRLRNWIGWATETDARLALVGKVGLGFGGLLILLGIVAFR